jgi:hypothetical protein
MNILLTILAIPIGLIVTSFLLVGIGLPFKRTIGSRDFENGTSVIQYELPHWLKWLQNPEDGLTGDKQGGNNDCTY